ncbi:HET-domain-containing protein [Lindgomyces ingoldianus]|uniref:HET-domain-containing protein n=1 Tax=Lindgomyces ingoldianus TaxID=673940 RepID=A0ACB6R8E3_9PLEO|nr:HET-domain-containing protein [Lindgomyces ingoldianus]KAF2475524.1 HET-domain-containing protein [Lindgomyces ingoldianus]
MALAPAKLSPTRAENINQLCYLCKSIKFQLHFKDDCAKKLCPINLWYSLIVPEPITVHSDVFPHHIDFSTLRTSAESGCHLCTLFLSSLARESSQPKPHFNASRFPGSQISLVYGATMTGKSELLHVIYQDKSAELDIVSIPLTLAATKDLFTLFVAVSHTSRKFPSAPSPPILAGYPLLEYQPNDEFEILHVWNRSKPLWLARHCTDADKPIGWIKPKHHRTLKDHPSLKITRQPPVWEFCRIARRERAYLDVIPDSEGIVSQIQAWVGVCESSHRPCYREAEPKLPPRVIDVGAFGQFKEPVLIETNGERGKYLALSYRWGKANTLCTTTNKLAKHLSAIPLSSMPQTMQDAVIVTRKLGHRYLWIDALCILQDSNEDWEYHASQMHIIFANAWLVVSADAAGSCSSGFLTPRNTLEVASCEHPSLFLDSSARPKKVICPRIPHAQDAINQSVLSTRGWILQERLLARRIIHWTQYEVSWACNELEASERQPAGIISSADDREPRVVADWRDLRHTVQLASPTRRHAGASFRCPKNSFYKLAHLIPEVNVDACWYQLVEEYSRRILTRPEDKLPAISGLVRSFRKQLPYRTRYVAGMWSHDLPQALLWRRDLTSSTQNFIHSSEEYIAPSFSWASCPAPVKYMPRYSSRNSRFPTQVLGFHTTLRGTDELGMISSGWLKLRGPTVSFSTLHAGCPQPPLVSDHQTGLFLDSPSSIALPSSDILVLSVRNGRGRSGSSSPSPFGRYACILLAPVGEKRQYKRVGYYEPEPYLYQSSMKRWHVTVLTIV